MYNIFLFTIIMKTSVKIFLTAAMMLIFNIAANAQIWVEGVNVFTKMTKEQVITKFGEPIKCEVNDSGDNGIDVWYFYDDDSHFVFKDNSFIEFTICSNRFKVRLEGLDCDVKVGDKFSVLEPLKPIYMDWFEKNWYCIYYYDEKVRFEVIDGIIQCIVFSASL